MSKTLIADREKQLPRPKRKNDPDRTKQDILKIAHQEFCENGLNGARIDIIAERTRTSKRMIYYYFGSKEGLYSAVLDKAYSGIREREAELNLESRDPVSALRSLIETTFDYDEAHPDFINLVSIENLHQAEYMEHSDSIRGINSAIIKRLNDILDRGKADGVFRDDLDAVDVHMAISALCFFRVANRHTFKIIFKRDLFSARVRARHKRMICDAILGMLAP